MILAGPRCIHSVLLGYSTTTTPSHVMARPSVMGIATKTIIYRTWWPIGRRLCHRDHVTTFLQPLCCRTVSFIYDSAKSHPNQPILAVNGMTVPNSSCLSLVSTQPTIAWPSPHGPHTPAPQYAGHFAGRQVRDVCHISMVLPYRVRGHQAPRTPSYNASEQYMRTKNWFMQQLDVIDDKYGVHIAQSRSLGLKHASLNLVQRCCGH
jgi:hypothetical protein